MKTLLKELYQVKKFLDCMNSFPLLDEISSVEFEKELFYPDGSSKIKEVHYKDLLVKTPCDEARFSEDGQERNIIDLKTLFFEHLKCFLAYSFIEKTQIKHISKNEQVRASTDFNNGLAYIPFSERMRFYLYFAFLVLTDIKNFYKQAIDTDVISLSKMDNDILLKASMLRDVLKYFRDERKYSKIINQHNLIDAKYVNDEHPETIARSLRDTKDVLEKRYFTSFVSMNLSKGTMLYQWPKNDRQEHNLLSCFLVFPMTKKAEDFLKNKGVCLPSMEHLRKEEKKHPEYKKNIISFRTFKELEKDILKKISKEENV